MSHPLADFYTSTESIPWPEKSIIRVTTKDNQRMILHLPILQIRWNYFNECQEEVLKIIQDLNIDQLRAVLLYVYSDLPARQSMANVFERCKLRLPQSLQESTFIEDMRRLMKYQDSTDFELFGDSNNNVSVRVHRAILSSRSKYFRSMFILNSKECQDGYWVSPVSISLETLEFFVEYLYTGQISLPKTISLIPLIWLVKYLRLSGEKEVGDIIISSLTRDLNENTKNAIYETAKKWEAKSIISIIEKYK